MSRHYNGWHVFSGWDRWQACKFGVWLSARNESELIAMIDQRHADNTCFVR